MKVNGEFLRAAAETPRGSPIFRSLPYTYLHFLDTEFLARGVAELARYADDGATPSAVRGRRNHVKKIIGKPHAGRLHVRIEGGTGNRAVRRHRRPDYQ